MSVLQTTCAPGIDARVMITIYSGAAAIEAPRSLEVGWRLLEPHCAACGHSRPASGCVYVCRQAAHRPSRFNCRCCADGHSNLMRRGAASEGRGGICVRAGAGVCESLFEGECSCGHLDIYVPFVLATWSPSWCGSCLGSRAPVNPLYASNAENVVDPATEGAAMFSRPIPELSGSRPPEHTGPRPVRMLCLRAPGLSGVSR